MPRSGDGVIPRLVPYRLGPFAFYSAIELPELPLQAEGASEQGIVVEVRRGETPRALQSEIFRGDFCAASATEFLLDIPDVARYYVRAGEQITVETYPGALPLNVRAYLLGNIFAVLCHQRRLLPLHASAVKMGDGVVAFLGASGAGKSTLAAFLSREGYPLVADDICLLDPAASVERRVLPVAPWLKLWRASLEALGQGADGLSQTFSEEDKFRLPLGREPEGAAEALPSVVQDHHLSLRAVVVLERGVSGQTILTPLKPVQAIGQMMNFTYQAFLLKWLGLQEAHFASCGKGLEGARAYRCEREFSFNSFPALLARLREEFG